jgi:small-conductance mechanosensitive channel
MVFQEASFIIAKAIFVFAIAFALSYFLRKSLMSIKKYNQQNNVDNTKLIFIKNSLNFLIYTIAVIVVARTIPQLKDVGTSLLAGAGIMAAIVGFASQAAFSNIVSGIFIIIFKPFKVDDIVSFKDGLTGVVSEITFRHTVIRDFENRRIIIPNTIISNETIINSSIDDERVMKHIFFSIGYEADVDKAMKIIQEEISNHPNFIDGRKSDEVDKPLVPVMMTDWGQSSIQLRANAWTLNAGAAFVLKCDVLQSIKKRFDQEGIEIPYPYQNVIVQNKLPNS